MKNYAERLIEQFSDKELADAHVDDFLNIAIATQIKILREQRGFTQSELAKLAAMEQSEISVMEDIDYSSWSTSTLKKLASAFDVSLKVSFEAYDTLIVDTANLSKESLERDTRMDSLKKLKRSKQIADKSNDYPAGLHESTIPSESIANLSCRPSIASEKKVVINTPTLLAA